MVSLSDPPATVGKDEYRAGGCGRGRRGCVGSDQSRLGEDAAGGAGDGVGAGSGETVVLLLPLPGMSLLLNAMPPVDPL